MTNSTTLKSAALRFPVPAKVTRSVARVRRSRPAFFNRSLAAVANGFGGEVLQAGDRLLSNRQGWSKPPAVSGFVASYLAN
ncbi:MAG TPA: hypothetical protein PKZ32_06315 [Candidatus Melainabacteria bacterium]|nr:hypothetical protein [Candidatus Melainabacteria bacterium]